MRPPSEPLDESLESDVDMKNSFHGCSSTPPDVLCHRCAKFHPDNGQICRVPRCPRCRLHHNAKERCGVAKARHEKRGLVTQSPAEAGDAFAQAASAIQEEIRGDPELQGHYDRFMSSVGRKRAAEPEAEKSSSKRAKMPERRR